MPPSLAPLLPFVVVAFSMWATPGPNNMMLMVSGARFGLRRTLPQLFGILTGTLLLSTLGIVLLEPVIAAWPRSVLLLKLVGTVWLVRIGWRMAHARLGDGPGGDAQPMRYLPATLFQFTNPKAITGTVALASLALSATQANPWLPAAALLTAAPLCLVANGAWALAGRSLRRCLSTPLRWRVFTLGTGFVTAGCAVFLWT
ncbi:LysE family translocator [Burkholderia sp. Ac-20379]|uniref:LysE family translocator n=1 Tax=Burkholderia sp. Ac-20379 TaxID=2703900 RepID=UPI00197EB123|nr:LysE family transporter [Burkholderia sp. Ac-20379]MBN3728199.1 LysE family transporter [Burkholderia sp. Ac-20379]